MNHPEPIDWDKALATVGGDPELLNEILGVYIAEAKEMIGQMKVALASNDQPLLRRAAHTLKGASMSMGATKTTEESQILEQGSETMDEPSLSAHVQRVEAAASAAIVAIENHLSAGKSGS